MRRALFPSLTQAYEIWLGNRDTARLADVVARAETHWLETARQLTATYHRDPALGDSLLNALADSGLVKLQH